MLLLYGKITFAMLYDNVFTRFLYIYINLSRLIWCIQHRQIPLLVVILPWKLQNESKENLTLQRRPWLCPRRWYIKDILLRHFINYIYKCTISWFCFIRNVIYQVFCNINDVLVESRACWLDDRCILSFNEWLFFYMLINEYRVCSLYHTFSFHNLHRMFWFSSLGCPFLVTLRF